MAARVLPFGPTRIPRSRPSTRTSVVSSSMDTASTRPSRSNESTNPSRNSVTMRECSARSTSTVSVTVVFSFSVGSAFGPLLRRLGRLPLDAGAAGAASVAGSSGRWALLRLPPVPLLFLRRSRRSTFGRGWVGAIRARTRAWPFVLPNSPREGSSRISNSASTVSTPN